MTPSEHQVRHVELHHALDELLADWLQHTNHLPSTSTVLELMRWSHEQTLHPTELQGYAQPHTNGKVQR